MNCKNCGWERIECSSCHAWEGLVGWINFSKDEIQDMLVKLNQCKSEGYLNYGDPAYSAIEKLQDAQQKGKYE